MVSTFLAGLSAYITPRKFWPKNHTNLTPMSPNRIGRHFGNLLVIVSSFMDYYRANGDLGRKNVVKKRGASSMTLTIDQGKITPYAHAPLLRHCALGKNSHIFPFFLGGSVPYFNIFLLLRLPSSFYFSVIFFPPYGKLGTRKKRTFS